MNMKELKKELLMIHNDLMQVSVMGESVPHLSDALVNLTRVINTMPEESPAEEVGDAE